MRLSTAADHRDGRSGEPRSRDGSTPTQLAPSPTESTDRPMAGAPAAEDDGVVLYRPPRSARPAPRVDVTLRDPRTLSLADRSAWSRLSGTSAEPNPFFASGFVEPATRHLPTGSGVRLLVARDAERWIACVPVVADRRWRRARVPCLRTWTHPYGFLGTPLLDGEDPERAASALLQAAGWRPLLALEGVRADGPVAAALTAAAPQGMHVLHRVERAALTRRSVAEPVSRPGRRRREHARLRRRLDDELAAPSEVREIAPSRQAAERFLTLEASGWKGRSGTAMGADPTHQAFFHALCSGTDPALGVTMLELGTADRTAASLVLLHAGLEVFAFKLAHDDALGSGAPGALLLGASRRWFRDATAAERLDSCAAPDQALANRTWTDRTPIASFVVPGPGVAGAAVGIGLQTAIRRRLARQAARG